MAVLFQYGPGNIRGVPFVAGNSVNDHMTEEVLDTLGAPCEVNLRINGVIVDGDSNVPADGVTIDLEQKSSTKG